MATKSPAALERETDQVAAETALKQADAKELHVLFERAQQRYTEMEDALTKVVMHYVGEKEVPRYMPNNDNAVAAMERIAMEALTLARLVVVATRQAVDAVDPHAASTGTPTPRVK